MANKGLKGIGIPFSLKMSESSWWSDWHTGARGPYPSELTPSFERSKPEPRRTWKWTGTRFLGCFCRGRFGTWSKTPVQHSTDTEKETWKLDTICKQQQQQQQQETTRNNNNHNHNHNHNHKHHHHFLITCSKKNSQCDLPITIFNALEVL